MVNIKRGQNIAILGSGALGKGIALELKNVFDDQVVVDIGDSNPERIGKNVLGKKIHSLGDLAQGHYDLLIMGFSASDANYEKAKSTLIEKFSCEIVSARDLFKLYPGIRVWPLLDSGVANSRKADFDFIAAHLADNESVSQYQSYYQWVCKDSEASPPEGGHENQYFDDQIIQLRNDEVFIDCGAYDGDTLNSFLQKTSNVFHEYYAFEPDERSFSKLVAYVSTLESHVRRRILVFNEAIANRSGYIGFDGDGSQFAHPETMSENIVLATSLEEFCFHKSPTFIKMDLEGYDFNALLGGIRKIVEIRPLLCVAIYHNPEDFLDIPLFLLSSLKNYQFFVRAHNNFGLDFILYCVPNERSK